MSYFIMGIVAYYYKKSLTDRVLFRLDLVFFFEFFIFPSLWSQTLPFKVPNILHLSKT